MAASLLRHAQLKPHGDNLLTSSAAFWLQSARVLVFLMAGAEAIAWGYLGYLFGEGATRWVGAGIVGTVIFLVVWMIDASLITMDRAWHEHSAALLGQKSNDGRATKTIFTFGVRIALLIGSLWVTVPYLAQVVFHKDIQRFIDSTAVANLDASRQAVLSRFDRPIASLSAEIEQARTSYEREVAGAGLSGRYGMGPAAKAMAETVATKTADRERLVQERKAALDAYDTLASDWRTNRDVLAATYNVELPQTSIFSNRNALEELRKRPEIQSTELAIKGFLAFIFTGLFLLKLFEPSSVRLYMSDMLQQEFLRYRAGTFDDRLLPTERSTVTPSPMSPQRLYDFLVRVWVPHLRSEYQEAETLARNRAVERSLRELESVRDLVKNEVEAAAAAYRESRRRTDEASRSVIELKSAIEIVKADTRGYQEQLERWRVDVGGPPLDEESRHEHAMLRSEVRQRVTESNRALEQLHENQPREEERLRRAEEDRARHQREYQQKSDELAALSKQIRDLRLSSGAADLQFHSPLTTSGN